MHAPVVFKRAGIEERIIANANQYLGPVWNEVHATDVERLPLRSGLRNPVGAAPFNESNLRFRRLADHPSGSSTPNPGARIPQPRGDGLHGEPRRRERPDRRTSP